MKRDIRKAVRQKLDDYLETNNLRKTPERYAILDAVFSLRGHFSMEELGEYLTTNNFRVSRATLYNNLRLFKKLRFVVCHRLQNGTRYESCSDDKEHCHQICTVCGSVTEFNSSELIEIVNNLKLKRFKKDGFSLYIYGICSKCQAQITRRKSNRQKTKKNNINE